MLRRVLPLLLVGACSPFATAFAPAGVTLVLRNSKPISSRAAPSGVAALRLSDEQQEGSQYVKLEKTQTSWTGWGNSGNEKKVTEIKVDPSNPNKAIKAALLAARESEEIAKYLGGTESKTRAGITGDVEFVSFQKGGLVLRLTGNFWHNRQMVFDDVGKYMQKCCPGLITDIKIEDEAQLNGFAETSNAFKEREQITEEELRKGEAKGTNIYGEKLEGPAAEFRRKKLEADAKYAEEMARRKDLDQKSQGEQIAAIMAEKGLGGMFSSGETSRSELRPEDILESMM